MNIENLDEMEKLILENGCLDKEDDRRDERDYQLASIMPEAAIPEAFMCEDLSPVNHQIYPSCTSEAAIKGTKEQQEKVSNLSEGFNYRNTKKLSGLYNIGGDYIYRTLQAVCEFGVCENHLFPKPNRSMSWRDYVKLTPSEEAFRNAEKYKGETYWSMDKGSEHFRGSLSVFKTPIIFAMGWYRSYRDCKGVLPLPKDWFANHCVAAVGYDKNDLIVKNSYGVDWGDKGYFKIPFKDWDQHKIYHPYIVLDINKPNNKKMKLYGLIVNGVKTDQFAFANNVYHKINSVPMLEELHDAGVLDKESVEWKEKIEGIIGSEWGALKGDK